jgi:hypothetical protein
MTITVRIILALAAVVVWRVWFPGRNFDAVAWHDPVLVQRGVRLAMADRLIARRALNGKTRAEVVEMLGEPPDTGYFRNWDLVYWIGPERGLFGIDSEWLVARLGRDGDVVECRIVRD